MVNGYERQHSKLGPGERGGALQGEGGSGQVHVIGVLVNGFSCIFDIDRSVVPSSYNDPSLKNYSSLYNEGD